MTHQYELMVILDPEIDERTVAPSLDKFLNVIRNDGGTIDNVDVWGRRRLAYEINKKTEGIYAIVNFTATSAATVELDRQLKLSEAVMRTKVLRAEAGIAQVAAAKVIADEKAAQQAAAAAAARGKSGSSTTTTTSPASSGLIKPIPGASITSPYGMRLHPILHIWKLHDGTDFGAGCGTPIHAAASGTVTEEYYNGGYGNRLFIDHGVMTTSYNHMSGYAVKVGWHVTQGQVIGYVGTTGYSTGCHLHFMLWVNGTMVNPANYL